MGIIKQTFGGNIDLGIRSAQIRELIEIYAMSTGQQRGGLLAPSVSPSVFSQSGGVLTAQATYSNGTLNSVARPVGSGSQAVVVQSLQLVVNGQAATSVDTVGALLDRVLTGRNARVVILRNGQEALVLLRKR